MTKAEAKRRILGLFETMLYGDTEVMFGGTDPGTRDHGAISAALEELKVEFARRTKG